MHACAHVFKGGILQGTPEVAEKNEEAATWIACGVIQAKLTLFSFPPPPLFSFSPPPPPANSSGKARQDLNPVSAAKSSLQIGATDK